MIRVLAAALSAFIYLSQPAFVVKVQANETGHSEHDHADGDHGHEEGEHAEDHEQDNSSHEGEADGVRTLHAWTRATPGKTALLFVDIQNTSDHAVSITGGHSEVAESVELVGFQLKEGEPDHVALPPVPIKAGTEMSLAPNGLALRLNGVRMPLREGEEHGVEIEFDFGHIEMRFQVEAADAKQHSHAGHQH